MLNFRSLVVAVRRVGEQTRQFSTSRVLGANNRPLSSEDLQRPAGIASMMRLPVQQTSEGLDVCFVGVPMDTGTSNRSGARYGPRMIRHESSILKPTNKDTGAAPFETLNVADVGDLYFSMYNLEQAATQITDGVRRLISTGCKTLTLGGDHTITYPIMRAYKEIHGTMGLVHVDAHTDTADTMNGSRIAHGTPIRRVVEEGIVDPSKVIQIGIRGPGWATDDVSWGLNQGFRVVPARKCWYKSLVPLMEEVRQMMGDTPVYLSFDIDALDPAFAPGTGTPEVGGLTSIQGLEIIRNCRGLNLVGGDLVEVAPMYDTTGTTALTGANFLFEMLCVLPGVNYNALPDD